jgi:hypothetical protein
MDLTLNIFPILFISFSFSFSRRFLLCFLPVLVPQFSFGLSHMKLSLQGSSTILPSPELMRAEQNNLEDFRLGRPLTLQAGLRNSQDRHLLVIAAVLEDSLGDPTRLWGLAALHEAAYCKTRLSTAPTQTSIYPAIRMPSQGRAGIPRMAHTGDAWELGSTPDLAPDLEITVGTPILSRHTSTRSLSAPGRESAMGDSGRIVDCRIAVG